MDQRIADYTAQAYRAGLKYPVLVKSKEGQNAAHSHTFFCVSNEAGMRTALSFEPFSGRVLIQAYVGHYEQVYKVYGIGSWMRT